MSFKLNFVSELAVFFFCFAVIFQDFYLFILKAMHVLSECWRFFFHSLVIRLFASVFLGCTALSSLSHNKWCHSEWIYKTQLRNIVRQNKNNFLKLFSPEPYGLWCQSFLLLEQLEHEGSDVHSISWERDHMAVPNHAVVCDAGGLCANNKT